jgi:ketosteroid isomerase-like protein
MFEDATKAEIWSMVRAMNDAWTLGDPDDLIKYFHPDMVAVTPAARHRLEGGPVCIEGWKSFANSAKTHHWKEIDPMIHVHGNAAVVAYDFDMSFDMGGKTIQSAGRDLIVCDKRKWQMVGCRRSIFPLPILRQKPRSVWHAPKWS